MQRAAFHLRHFCRFTSNPCTLCAVRVDIQLVAIRTSSVVSTRTGHSLVTIISTYALERDITWRDAMFGRVRFCNSMSLPRQKV